MKRSIQTKITKTSVLLLLILSLSHCGTSKTQLPNPGFRGLTPSEAMTLEALNRPPANRRQWSENLNSRIIDQEALADLFLENGQYESAIYHYAKLLIEKPQQLELRYKIGLALYLMGKLPEAKQELSEVLAADPNLAAAHEVLGLVLLDEKKYAEAKREFTAVLGLNPGRVSARYYLGLTHLQAGEYQTAITELSRAQTANPTDARIARDLGWAYFHLKKYEAALSWLQKAAQLKGDDPTTYNRLGMVLAALKRYPEALAAYRKAGDEAQAYNNLGVHYFVEGRYLEAAKCFQKAVELRPSFYAEAQENLERTLAKLQETGKDGSHAYNLSQATLEPAKDKATAAAQ